MPGSEGCARCASPLGVRTMVMDVNPPRASPMAKRWRRFFNPLSRITGRADSAVRRAALLSSNAATHAADELPSWGLVWRLIVPGWSMLALGERRRGHLYLQCYLSFALSGLMFFGTVWGSIFLGLAVATHGAAAFDLFSRYLPDVDDASQNRRRAILATAGMIFAVYLPVYWAVTSVATPIVISAPIGPFLPGDVLLVNERLHWGNWPRVGQVVLYNQDQATRIGHLEFEFAGQLIDRVVARGGDAVLWDGGKLYVNGMLSEWRPLNPGALGYKIAFTAPAGTVVILPSMNYRAPPLDSIGMVQSLSCVSRNALVGNVYLRSNPPWRLKIIR